MTKRISLDKNRIVDLLVAGKTPREIASALNCCVAQVNFNITWHALDIKALNKGMIIGSYIENGVTVEKIKTAYAEGAEPGENVGYGKRYNQ